MNNDTYRGNPDYMTQTEALRYLRMHQLTFYRHSGILGIIGEKEGKYTFYKREDIERLKSIRDHIYTRALGVIEMKTGKKIKKIIFED